MAAMAGTAREMVGRALKVLEAAGAIQLQHGRIEVLSRDRLLVLV
jgi:CRP/FNR family transcriptional regulator